MALANIVSRWSEELTIQVAGTRDKYSQCTYTNTAVQGRLIQAEEEVMLKNGTKVISNAKLFTTTNLKNGDKIGNYIIMHEKTCKDKRNNAQFYKYYLSKDSKYA